LIERSPAAADRPWSRDRPALRRQLTTDSVELASAVAAGTRGAAQRHADTAISAVPAISMATLDNFRDLTG
jgi:hypothetical protein